MLSRHAKWIVVLALIFSIGGHWTILQTVAWVRMTVAYSNGVPLSIALAKTFDGRHPCNLCKFVNEGKKSERKSEKTMDLNKIDFFALNAAAFYFPPMIQEPSCSIPRLLSRVESPPTPPPLRA
jgi:hypothetical protein